MKPQNLTLAILFADLAESTKLYESLGNKLAHKIIVQCVSFMSELTKTHNGNVIHSIGDEILCVFPTAKDAIEAGKNMHEAIAKTGFVEKPDMPPPNIYVSIHFGPVFEADGDVFGDAVKIAEQMLAMAKQRQILTTEDTIKELPADHNFQLKLVDKISIKGRSEKMPIYEVVWEYDQLTHMVTDRCSIYNSNEKILKVKFGNQKATVCDNNPHIALGRQPHNDIVVEDSRVSRSHARIEYRHGKFYLIDQSTNGTHLMCQGEKCIHLRREEASLVETGIIGLGSEVTQSSPEAIEYSISVMKNNNEPKKKS